MTLERWPARFPGRPTAIRPISTPLGPLTLAAQAGRLSGAVWAAVPASGFDPCLIESEHQITEWFEGKRLAFDLPLALAATH